MIVPRQETVVLDADVDCELGKGEIQFWVWRRIYAQGERVG